MNHIVTFVTLFAFFMVFGLYNYPVRSFLLAIGSTFFLDYIQEPMQHVEACPPKIIQTTKPVAPVQPVKCTGLDCQIIAAANKKGIDPALVFALIKQESNHEKGQQSHAGAQGYMQVMPFHTNDNANTCPDLTVQDLWDTEKNLDCGMKILTIALLYWDKRFPDNQDKAILHALGEYNSGRGAVRDKESITRYPETRAYVIRILAYWKLFKDLKVSSYPRFHPHSALLIIGEKVADKHAISDVQFLTRTSFKFKTTADISAYLAEYDYVSVTTGNGFTIISMTKKDADTHIQSLSNQFFKDKGVQ